jgi:Uma2 family endonuclease
VTAKSNRRPREFDMTAEMTALHPVLQRLDTPDGLKAEMINGEIVLAPLRLFHLGTIFEILRQVTPQLPADTWFGGDNITPFPEYGAELCPDITLIPKSAYDKNLSVVPAEMIRAAFEVVSPSTRGRDYGLKVGAYARAGIPLYVIADPYTAVLTVHHDPVDGEYALRRIVRYGASVDVPGELPFTLDTSTLPVDRGGD